MSQRRGRRLHWKLAGLSAMALVTALVAPGVATAKRYKFHANIHFVQQANWQGQWSTDVLCGESVRHKYSGRGTDSASGDFSGVVRFTKQGGLLQTQDLALDFADPMRHPSWNVEVTGSDPDGACPPESLNNPAKPADSNCGRKVLEPSGRFITLLALRHRPDLFGLFGPLLEPFQLEEFGDPYDGRCETMTTFSGIANFKARRKQVYQDIIDPSVKRIVITFGPKTEELGIDDLLFGPGDESTRRGSGSVTSKLRVVLRRLR